MFRLCLGFSDEGNVTVAEISIAAGQENLKLELPGRAIVEVDKVQQRALQFRRAVVRSGGRRYLDWVMTPRNLGGQLVSTW